MDQAGLKVRDLRERLGWSQTKLATLAGISQSYLWRLENGKQRASWEIYTRIAGALGHNVDILFPSSGNVEDAQLGWRRIPLLDYVQAGEWKQIIPQIDDEAMREYILTDLTHPPSSFALRIKGDSMEPEFYEGEAVVIAPTVSPRPGDCVVATDENGEATFKIYREIGRNELGQEVFELLPLNSLYSSWRSDRQAITIVGTMVEHHKGRRSDRGTRR